MLKPRLGAALFSAGLTVVGAGSASGQEYPNKPIRIVTSPIGGGNDFMTRLIAQGLTGPLGQPVIVDNRPTGLTGETVSKAQPDGYTLLFASSSLWIAPLLQKMPYDVERDFAPISMVDRAPNILVVHPSLPVKSVKELIALAKARPGELNYSSGGVGVSAHLAAELFQAMAGVKIVGIRYKGSGAALNDLIGGQVQLNFATATAVTQHLKSGRLKALAVTSAEPSMLIPGLTTVAASLPGYESVSIDAVFAPAKTPVAIINRLNQEIVRFLNQAGVKEKFFTTGVETVSSSPEQLAAKMKSEMASMGKVIKDAGIRAD